MTTFAPSLKYESHALFGVRILLGSLAILVALDNSLAGLPDDLQSLGPGTMLPVVMAASLNLILLWCTVVLALGIRVRGVACVLAIQATILLQLAAEQADLRWWHDYVNGLIVVLALILVARGGGGMKVFRIRRANASLPPSL